MPSSGSCWQPVSGSRYPWAPAVVSSAIRSWLEETQYAEELVEAGEKLMPLLLSGETRCGKTSTLCHIADHYGLPVYRLSIPSIVGKFMGETARSVTMALEDAKAERCAVWILDEMDALFQSRNGGGSDGASKEWNAALGSSLSAIENLPPNVLLVGTTNEVTLIDAAMIARFQLVVFPTWSELTDQQRESFAKSHGYPEAGRSRSYAEAVQKARAVRVSAIIAAAKAKESKAL